MSRLVGSLFLFIGISGTLCLLNGSSLVAAGSGQVTAKVETAPVPHRGDAADDPAIWIHPTDPAKSTIIGTDKEGGLEVYDLAGNRLQVLPIRTGNVDLRYNFPLGGERVALVTGYSKTYQGLFAYKVNPTTRLLEEVLEGRVKTKGGGSAMYHSPVSGKFYLFQNGGGELKQFELFDNGQGQVNVKEVRAIPYSPGGKSEAVVADDGLAQVYVSEETEALWKFGAEPNAGATRTAVDKPIALGGHFQPDIEGLTIYYRSDGTGYLIASSQGNNSYTIYERECDNDYLGKFTIVAGPAIDGVTNTDGIDVTNLPLGADFPHGVFVAQDGENTLPNANQNFKLVPWEAIARAFNPPLVIDPTWDPRRVGAQGAAPAIGVLPASGTPWNPRPLSEHQTFLPMIQGGTKPTGC